MAVYTETHSSFEINIKKAINALKEKDYAASREFINNAMLENYNSPEVHNLIGILEELTGDLSLARKHYRAAWALDPTYKPASRNLERVSYVSYTTGNAGPDFGDKPEEEKSIPYVIEYDKKNVGHLVKKSK